MDMYLDLQNAHNNGRLSKNTGTKGPSTNVIRTLGFYIGIDYSGWGHVLPVWGLRPRSFQEHSTWKPALHIPERQSTQYLWTLVSKTIQGVVFETKNLKYWVLGPSGYDNFTQNIEVLRQLMQSRSIALSKHFLQRRSLSIHYPGAYAAQTKS